MKRTFTLLFLIPNLFCVLLFIELDKQSSIQAQNNLFYPEIQSVIAPSPQATAITKYGDYPVNHNTGLVDMRIPIYNVKSGSLNMPIDISFHASGRMANEVNGVLGMRWVLNAGGVVTRTVHGYPDEWENLTAYSVDHNMIPDYDLLRQSCPDGFIAWKNDSPNSEKTDSEFDVFSYVLPSGKNGKFILKNENGTKKAVQIPFEALKIELEQDSSYYGHYGAIKITDTDGTIYNYGDGNASSSYCEHHDSDDIPGKLGTTPTGWYLKSIVSADKNDTIQFEYQSIIQFSYNWNETVTTMDRVRDYSVYADFDPYDYFGPWFFENLYELPREISYGPGNFMKIPVLKSIKFKGGELNFYYGHTDDSQTDTNNTFLQTVILSGEVNRKFKFNQQLDPNENFIRYLNDFEILSILDNIENLEEKYIFDYYRPSTINNEPYGEFSERKDWWGYYNSSTANLLPLKSVDFRRTNGRLFEVVNRDIGHSNVLRDPDFESIKLGMLKSISYPTGGKTEFEYENNYYKIPFLPSLVNLGPGLRIKKVTNKPVNGNDVIKTYKYGENGDGSGYMNIDLTPGKHTVQERSNMTYWDYLAYGILPYGEEEAGYRIRTYSSEPLINPEDFGGNIVRYNMVTEYSETDLQGEYSGKGKNGKTIYEYSQKLFDTKQFEIIDHEYNIDYPKVFADPSSLWKGGKLLAKTVYKMYEEGDVPTLKESYNYTDTIHEELWDMPIYRHVSFFVNKKEFQTTDKIPFQYNEEKDYHNNTCSVYGYGFRKYVSGSEKIASKTIEYFDGDGITSTTEYFYDPQYDQLRKEEVTKSDGNKIRFEYEYAFDKMTSPLSDMTNVYNKMLNMNMVSIPLSKSQYKIDGVNNVFVQSKKTEFYEPFTNIVCPKTEYYKKGDEVEEAILKYHNYDEKGNIIEVSQVDGTHIVYIWGYDKEYPVAKIQNMIYANIPSSLISAIELASSSTGSESALLTALNNLRNHTALTNAMVTTYTYKPLIGMTSMTDPKGDVTYYEYDSYGRLQQVKDKDNNVLSKNEYHYKNQ